MTVKIRKTLFNAKLAFLRAVIQDTRFKISNIELELYSLHLQLSNNQPQEFLMKIDTESWNHAVNIANKHQINLQNKFSKLQASICRLNNNQGNLPVVNSKPIVNMSSVQLNKQQECVLTYNSNFSKTNSVSLPNLIAPVEKTFKFSKISLTQKETIRHLIANICESNKKFNLKSNLSKQENDELRSLKSNPNLVITKADKGGQIVLLDKPNYMNKVMTLLNEGPYLKINKDTTNNDLLKVKFAVKSSPLISDCQKKYIVPSNANSARLYALPKVHKANVPFRPIVSCIGTPSYKLAKFLVSIFSTLSSVDSFSVKNSIEFVNKIKNLHPDDHIMVSFDVVSLFTNVPVEGAIHTLYLRLRDFHYTEFEISHLISLTKLCLSQNTFIFQGQYYRQMEGLAMGNPLSPILCEIYMFYFEKKLFNLIKFQFWVRYVDDTFALIKKDTDLKELLCRINNIDQYIQFTMETENNSTISFLDVLITRLSDKFTTTVFRKSFAVNLPPHAKSCHPYSQKMSAFYYYVNRALNICSDKKLLETELKYIKSVAINRGYSQNIVNKAYRKFSKTQNLSTTLTASNIKEKENCVLPFYPKISSKIAKILRKYDIQVIYKPAQKLQFSNLKDPIPENKKWGIYEIVCQCGLSYIGQTKRSLSIRLKEHISYVQKKEVKKSSVAYHSWECNHSFNFNQAKVIQTAAINELDFFEAYHTHRRFGKIVNDISATPPFQAIWKSLLF